MKISDVQAGKALLQPPETRPARESSRAFEELLSKSVSQVQSSGTAPRDVHGVRPAQQIFFDMPHVDREELAGRVAQFLSELEDYAGRLGSQQATLKDISPLVGRISGEQAQLQQLAEKLPLQDDLRRIIDEALVRSSVEVIKFNRGDYV